MLSYPFTVTIAVRRVPEVFPFLLRPISRWEYMVWKREHPNRMEFEDRLLKEAVLTHPPTFREQPWDWDAVYAGVTDQVITKILYLSGYGPDNQEPDPDVIGPVKEYFESQEARCDLCILLGSQGLTLMDVLKLSPYEYYLQLGMAKRVLAFNGIDPDSVLDPNWKPKKGKRGGKTGGGDPRQYLPGGSHDVTPFGFHQPSQTGHGSAHDRSVQNERTMVFTAD